MNAIATSDFEYVLPPDLIAQVPIAERSASRLLVVTRPDGEREDRRFGDLADLVPPGDLVILNSTKVRHARLLGTRPSGAPAEVLLIHPAGDGTWIALGQPGSAMKVGRRINLGAGFEVETVEILDGPHRRVRFLGGTAEAAMARLGRLPLPPYIDRAPTPEDDHRYQTVFAEREGSVAAPTAGLHFTESLLGRLEASGARIGKLDLEVGPGTFRPVEVADPRRHVIHRESYTITPELVAAVAATRRAGHHIWAVGTTVVRALESAADADGALTAGRRDTELLILPGFRFRIVDRLITNFHLPRSTLLMLVTAFGGREAIQGAYRHAIESRYRFYSYGDAMLIR